MPVDEEVEDEVEAHRTDPKAAERTTEDNLLNILELEEKKSVNQKSINKEKKSIEYQCIQ